MRSPALRLACFGLLLALAPSAAAQLAQSATVKLVAFSLDAAGGGSGSLNIASHGAIADLSGEPMTSPDYTVHCGFLAAHDPGVTNAPIVFGIQPAFGPKAGGTAVSITGLNFDRFGTGPSISATIDGVPVQGLVVQSNSLITGTTPPGVSGPLDVVVAGSLGSTTKPGGFIDTPAITTTGVVPIGGPLTIRNYGPVGNFYWSFVSLTAWSAQTRFGTLLIGPNFFELLQPTAYPPTDGVASLTLTVPNNPVLHGITVHFQSLSLTQLQPAQGSLTNASLTNIP